jgi:hypothetical protein
MFENLRQRRKQSTRPELSQAESERLRQMGLNPDDFRDAFEGRRCSVLFNPFRSPRG